MSWAYTLEQDGLPFDVSSGNVLLHHQGEVVGFYIRDADTITAIRRNDPRILSILNDMLDDIDAFSLAKWAKDSLAFYHWRKDDGLDEYERKMNILVHSRWASNKTRETALEELSWIATERKRHAQRKVKQQLTARRRSDFDKERDRLMLALIARDGYQCAVCGTTDDITIDHIIALSKGGSDDLDNLRLVCRPHNSEKGDR